MVQPGEHTKILTTLQAGRAIAALAVVMTHTNIALTAFGQQLPILLSLPASRGFLGVDFFFVLSGFIIGHAHGQDTPGARSAGSYLAKRSIRIYLPYLPVTIGLIALYVVLPSLSQADREWNWATSLFLIPSDQPPALSVAWTLVHEAAFYAVFLLFFFFTRWFSVIVATWGAIIVLLWATGYDPGERNDWGAAFLAPINLEFIAGMAAAWLANRLDGRWGLIVLGVGAAGASLYLMSGSSDRVLFGLSLAPVVLGVALLEQDGKLRAPRWLVFLGGASYAIYLVHNPLISVAVRLTQQFGAWQIGLAFCLIVAVGLGCAYHLWVEKPAMKAARRLMQPKSAIPRDASRTPVEGTSALAPVADQPVAAEQPE